MLKLLTSAMMLASHSTKRLACYSAVAAPEALTSYNIAQYTSTCVVRDLGSYMLAKCAPQPHALVPSAHLAITIALSRVYCRCSMSTARLAERAIIMQCVLTSGASPRAAVTADRHSATVRDAADARCRWQALPGEPISCCVSVYDTCEA